MPAARPDHSISESSGHTSSESQRLGDTKDDVELTVSFLGCPSTSTKFPLSQTSVAATHDKADSDAKRAAQTKRCESFSRNYTDRPWKKREENNNNRCGDDTGEVEESEMGEAEDGEDSRTYEAGTEECDGSGNAFTMESLEDKLSCMGPSKGGSCGLTAQHEERQEDKACVDKQASVSAPGQTCVGREHGTPRSGDGPKDVHKESAEYQSNYGNAIKPKVNRYPSRDHSPPKKKENSGRRLSAPVMLQSAQKSPGCTNIRVRGAGEASFRRESFRASNKTDTRQALHATRARVETFTERDDTRVPSFCRRAVSLSVSKFKSPTIPEARQIMTSSSPTSPKSSRDSRQSSPASSPAFHLMLPGDSATPHGDAEPTSPQKKQQGIYESLLDPSTYSQTDDTHSPMKIGECGNITDDHDPATSPVTLKAGATGARPSRRHPVLDKMFHCVLTSLLQENGPPNSACLSTVLDHDYGKRAKGETADSKRSQLSGTSLSSNYTNPFKKRLLAIRAREAASIEQVSSDTNPSMYSTLPYSLEDGTEVESSCQD